MTIFSFALGIGTTNSKGEWLEVYYPCPMLNPDEEMIATLAGICGYQGKNEAIKLSADQVIQVQQAFADKGDNHAVDGMKGWETSERPIVATFLAEDAELSSTPEAYLKLHLLSHRLVKPHQISLAGIFPLLPNVAWTSEGAIDLEELPLRQSQARLQNRQLSIYGVDKFPRMTDYVVPEGVRIADSSRIRLGAYLGAGTTIMHEGFVNFNAGTEGPGMIEGRISAGVFVGKGSDLGGGCSTMGTLSGGNNVIISIGEECLIGANAGVGIPLGDRCTIEAGLYVTGGSKVSVFDDQGDLVETIKAGELAGKSDLLFRRNSVTGAIECLTNKSAIALNEELHSNN